MSDMQMINGNLQGYRMPSMHTLAKWCILCTQLGSSDMQVVLRRMVDNLARQKFNF